MALTITADRLLKGVKRLATQPNNQNLLEDSDILELIDDTLIDVVIPTIKATREDYWVYREDFPLTSGQQTYDIPGRAVGSTIRELKYKTSDSEIERDLTLISVEDDHRFYQSANTHSFYFRGDQIVLIPAPSETGAQLQIDYEMRPSTLVLEENSAKVISVSGTDVSVNLVPGNLVIGVEADFIKGKPNHSIRDYDEVITNIVGNIISFSEVPSNLAAGDYISFAGTTPVLQAPVDCYPYLEYESAIRVLFQIGDFQAADMLQKKSQEAKANLLKLLEPRITGEPRRLVNRNGLLRGKSRGYRRSYYY